MRWTCLLLSLFLVACGDTRETGVDQSFGGNAVFATGGADGLAVTGAEADAILALVNSASLEVLDVDVRLDVRAARAIVDARSSSPIADLDALDDVPWVGKRAFNKLREYVHAEGLVQHASDCLIISEYIEGKADKNKAVELLNCGTRTMQLDSVAICLIRNDDKDCTAATALGERELAAGDTLVLCRQIEGQWKNPEVWIADACEVEVGSTAIYSGDDRLALVRDSNADRRWSVESDEVLDVLGRIGFRPTWSPWNDVRLQRCRLEPNDGRAFYDTDDWFTTDSWSRGAGSDLGRAPTETCD